MTAAHPDLIAFFEKKLGAAFPGNTGHLVAVELAEGVAALGFELRADTLIEAAGHAAHVYGGDAEYQATQAARYLTLIADNSVRPPVFEPLTINEIRTDLESINEIGTGEFEYFRSPDDTLLVRHYGGGEDNPTAVTSIGRVDINVVDVTSQYPDELLD
jgi:hypothetical protein